MEKFWSLRLESLLSKAFSEHPNSISDIACWFIDTNYNGESFFVRHVYFTGADDSYGKLQRALRAEIDESA